MPEATYLGDSVYAEYESASGMIKLFLNNGFEAHSEIFLEPEVYIALSRFVKANCPSYFGEEK